MLELKGKYTNAKIFADIIDSAALNQIRALCNLEIMKGCKIRVMPDAHAGVGCTIGTTIEINGAVIPNVVGLDIGCGMYVVKLSEKKIERPKLDSVVRKLIPIGSDVREREHRFVDQISIQDLKCKNSVHISKVKLGLGTLGGGNHFIESGRGSDGNLYIIIHSGSRHLGAQVANHYQLGAYNSINAKHYNSQVESLSEQYKKMGKEKEIGEALGQLRKTSKEIVPKMLAYCTGQLLEDYMHDTKIVQQYAILNRKAIMYDIVKNMKLHVLEEFSTIHNYIDSDNMIVRKGAVSAQVGEKLIIPINMIDGSLLCIGKGNPDWNYSAPHGAGRLMSRSKAKESFTVSEYKRTMKEADVYSSSVGESTLDECSMAYKPMQSILDNIQDTVKVIDIIKPIYNFKAGNKETTWMEN